MANKQAIKVKQIRFLLTIGIGATARLEDDSELTGKITEIMIHWPNGCNALVDVAVGWEQTWLTPSTPDTYLALNDATPIFKIEREGLRRDDIIWAILRNRDGANTHSISIAVTTVGVEGPE